jgi:hypothetical protein
MNTMAQLAGATSPRMRGNFVMLRADAMRLLLPQQEVSSTEYIDSTPSTTAEAGIFVCANGDDQQRKVMALSDHLNALTSFPAGRFLLTQLSDVNNALSFAWNEVRVLINADLESHPLPAVMQGPGTLVDSYIELDGELVFCMDARRLLSHTMQCQA